MTYFLISMFFFFLSFTSPMFFNTGRGHIIMLNTGPPYKLGNMPVPISNSMLDINQSNSTFNDWRIMERTGLDMRYGPDLAEAGPYFRADDGLSIADLRFLRDKFVFLQTLRNPNLPLHQKIQLIEYNRHLFPPHLDWSLDDVTGTDLHQGGLLNDWNFDNFDVL